MAFGCTFETGSDEFFEWLMRNGYPELGAFSRAIQGEAKAKEWLMKNGFLQLVAIDNVIDKDENAEVWLAKNHFEVDLAFAKAINCDDDATEWLEKNDLQVFVILAKKIRKYLDDKYLEDEYNNDIQGYKEEIRNLEINNKNLSAMVLNEEKCLSILNKKLNQLDKNNNEKIEDEIAYLYNSSRLESLSNEQQCFYVSIDVLKNEIEHLWNKGDNSDEDYEITETEEASSMYEEEPVENMEETENNGEEVIEELTPEEEAAQPEEENIANQENEEPAVEFIDSLE